MFMKLVMTSVMTFHNLIMASFHDYVMDERLIRFITQELLEDVLITKMGNKYYIYLPKRKNKLWEKLHEEKILLNILITWDWSRRREKKCKEGRAKSESILNVSCKRKVRD